MHVGFIVFLLSFERLFQFIVFCRRVFPVAIERGVMERVYKLAMFPNGDGDTQRDKIFHESVALLSNSVTPSHR